MNKIKQWWCKVRKSWEELWVIEELNDDSDWGGFSEKETLPGVDFTPYPGMERLPNHAKKSENEEPRNG